MFAAVLGSLTPTRCSEEKCGAHTLSLLAAAPSSAQGRAGLGNFRGREANSFRPPLASAELCPRRVPAGHLPGKFRLFLGELSVASCLGSSSHPLFPRESLRGAARSQACRSGCWEGWRCPLPPSKLKSFLPFVGCATPSRSAVLKLRCQQLSAGVLLCLPGMGELEQPGCCFSFYGLSKYSGLYRQA